MAGWARSSPDGKVGTNEITPKAWRDEAGRQWTWEVHVVLSRAVHEGAPALVIVMDAHANPLRVRGVNGDENESAHDHQHGADQFAVLFRTDRRHFGSL
jgi:hypothetical protein